MALFGDKESKEEKQARKEQELLTKFGLQDLNNPDDIASVKKIIQELAGSSFGEAAVLLSGKVEDRLPICYQRAIVEQNWIIIRQLDKLNTILGSK